MTGLAAHIQADNIDFSSIEFANLIPVSGMSLGFMANAEKLNMPIGQMELSVNMDFFSRIYDIAFGEKGNKDMELDNRTENFLAQKEEEKKQDSIQNAVEEVLEGIQDKINERMQSKYGYDFDEQDFKKALRENLENWDEFSKGMEPEKADELHSLTILALTAEGDELERIKERMDVLSSERMEQTERRASEIKGERTQSLELSESSAEVQSVSRVDDLETKIQDRLLERPASKISSTFSSEVDGSGTNAQSFTLDEEPQVAFVEKSPDTFVLDA